MDIVFLNKPECKKYSGDKGPKGRKAVNNEKMFFIHLVKMFYIYCKLSIY